MIDEMDFDQLASAWRGGKRRKGVEIESDAEIAEMSRNWRRYFHGL